MFVLKFFLIVKIIHERGSGDENFFEKVVILFMTPQDTKLISDLIEVKIDNRIDRLETKLFKWKSEVIDAVDALASEMKDSQDFREITTHQIVTNRERTDRLEKKVFGAVTSA